MSLPYEKQKIGKAKALRKNTTPQERRLWFQFLREYSPRFQRQRAIEGYIVDFYCHHAKLVVELDGSQHDMPQEMEYDEKRSACLEKYGLKILRFSNEDVNRRFQSVCQAIHQEVCLRTAGNHPRTI